MLYTFFDSYRKSLIPLVNSLEFATDILAYVKDTNSFYNMAFAQSSWLYEILKENHKPQFNIKSVVIDGKSMRVYEDVVNKKTFCNLIRFSVKDRKEKAPVLYIVAPLSGHYATLLRDTVTKAVEDFDVYITDWKNPRDIPLSEGDFGFDDYVNYVIDDFKFLKDKVKDFSCLAVCQPTVPVMAAVCYLEKIKSTDCLPKNVILMGGPIDTRISPTKVNEYAFNKDLDWFKRHVIHDVPATFKGFGRKVYPGFLQYSGFVSMNMKKHTKAQMDFFNHLIEGAQLDIDKHKEFYNEYNAVMDLPAKYYLETLENVFIDQKLPKGNLSINGQLINLKDVSHINLLTIEGEYDDISGAGQTHSTINLCENLAAKNKEAHTIKGVGHYGIFAGKTWRNVIYKEILKFTKLI